MAYDIYTKLLMHMDSIPLIDECGNTITNNSVTLNSNNYKFGNGSAYFNGSNSSLTINSSNFNFGLNNFTIEGFVYMNSYSGTIAGGTLFGTNVTGLNGWTLNLGENISKLRLISNLSGTWKDDITVSTGMGVPLQTWTHIALVRNADIIYIFVNGNLSAQKSGFLNYNFTGSLYYIGYFNNGAGVVACLNGNIDELRISNIARWTSNFTSPIHPYKKYYLINNNNQYKYFNKTTFLMSNLTNNPPIANDYRNYGNEDLSYLCTSYNQEVLQITNFATLGSGKYGYVDCNNKFLNVNENNNSNISYTKLLMHFNNIPFTDVCGHTITNNGVTLDTTTKKFGSGSGYFNGSSYLNIGYNSDLDFNSNDFTIDFWFYPTNAVRTALFASNTDYWLGIDYNYNGTRNINIWVSSNGTSWNILNADSGGNGIGTISLNLNTWNHIAFVRHGNNWLSFINGVIDKNVTASGSVISKNEVRHIGKWGAGSLANPNGYINEFRISNGIARWTSNFTLPTRQYNIGKYLIQDNTTNIIYTYNGTTLIQSASQTIDSSNFITNGFDDLTLITNTIWNSIFSDITHARILYYSIDTTTIESDLSCNINNYRPIDDLQNQFTIDLFQDNT